MGKRKSNYFSPVQGAYFQGNTSYTWARGLLTYYRSVIVYYTFLYVPHDCSNMKIGRIILYTTYWSCMYYSSKKLNKIFVATGGEISGPNICMSLWPYSLLSINKFQLFLESLNYFSFKLRQRGIVIAPFASLLK